MHLISKLPTANAAEGIGEHSVGLLAVRPSMAELGLVRTVHQRHGFRDETSTVLKRWDWSDLSANNMHSAMKHEQFSGIFLKLLTTEDLVLSTRNTHLPASGG